MTFIWSKAKNATNILKHKIDFAFAKNAFSDVNGVVLYDLDNSAVEEDRFILEFTYQVG